MEGSKTVGVSKWPPTQEGSPANSDTAPVNSVTARQLASVPTETHVRTLALPFNECFLGTAQPRDVEQAPSSSGWPAALLKDVGASWDVSPSHPTSHPWELMIPGFGFQLSSGKILSLFQGDSNELSVDRRKLEPRCGAGQAGRGPGC